MTTRLRRAYFAVASDQATRYGLGYERMLTHLWQARKFNPRLLLSTVKHIDDVVQVAACLDQNPLAWLDLIEQHEPALIRVCRRRMTAAEAIVFVRKLWMELRQQSRIPAVRGVPSLHGFSGQTALRSWLVDRALGRMGSRRNPRSAGRGSGSIGIAGALREGGPFSTVNIVANPLPLPDPA